LFTVYEKHKTTTKLLKTLPLNKILNYI